MPVSRNSAVKQKGGNRRRDGVRRKPSGESVACLDTRDRDPASGPRGMKRERRERMAGSHRFACGDRVSSRGQASARRTDRSRLMTRRRESV